MNTKQVEDVKEKAVRYRKESIIFLTISIVVMLVSFYEGFAILQIISALSALIQLHYVSEYDKAIKNLSCIIERGSKL